MQPLLSLLERLVAQSNRSFLTHAEFVKDALCELLEPGCVLEVVVPLLVVNPLSVSVQVTG